MGRDEVLEKIKEITADRLGVPPGPERGRLQAGEAIALDDGTVVTPAQVLGEPREPRTREFLARVIAAGRL